MRTGTGTRRTSRSEPGRTRRVLVHPGAPVALVLCVWLPIAACGGDGSPGDAPAVEPVARPAPVDTTPMDGTDPVPDQAAAPADEDTAGLAVEWRDPPLTGGSQDAGVAVLREVRTARHDDFDRIVFAFGPDPVPSYDVHLLDGPATQCGSGRPVETPAPYTLEVSLRPAAAHTEAGEPSVENRDRRLELPSARSLRLICDFEGHVDWVVGLIAPPQLRILTLEDPHRLVVDIRHPPNRQTGQVP